MGPLITIIIPMFNAEEYISKCLDSLIQQTYDNIEIIVVDDGSTDNSLRICKAYAEQDFRLKIIHQSNQGVSAARNRALQEAEGIYIVFVDADDYVGKDYVSDLWELVCNTKCDVAISRYSTELDYDVSQDSGKIRTFNAENAIINMLLSKGFDTSVCCKLVKKCDISGYEFRTDLVLAEDLEFFYKILKKCSDVAFIDKVDYFYVHHNQGAINRLSNSKVKSMRIFDELIEECDNAKILDALISKYVSTCFHLLSLNNSENIDLIEIENVIRKYRKKAIKGHFVAKKVKVACIMSYFSFHLVNCVLAIKRG